jgi:hypothetical protein
MNSMIRLPLLAPSLGELPKTPVSVPAWKTCGYYQLYQVRTFKDGAVYKTANTGMEVTREQYDLLHILLETEVLERLLFATIRTPNLDAIHKLYVPEDVLELVSVINTWSKTYEH